MVAILERRGFFRRPTSGGRIAFDDAFPAVAFAGRNPTAPERRAERDFAGPPANEEPATARVRPDEDDYVLQLEEGVEVRGQGRLWNPTGADGTTTLELAPDSLVRLEIAVCGYEFRRIEMR